MLGRGSWAPAMHSTLPLLALPELPRGVERPLPSSSSGAVQNKVLPETFSFPFLKCEVSDPSGLWFPSLGIVFPLITKWHPKAGVISRHYLTSAGGRGALPRKPA